MEFDDPKKIWGWFAVTLSLTYKFPQIYKLYTTKDIRGISVFSQLIQCVSYLFYVVHGTVIQDPPIVLLGCTSLAQSVVLVAQYFFIAYGWTDNHLMQVNQNENECSDDKAQNSGKSVQMKMIDIDIEMGGGSKSEE